MSHESAVSNGACAAGALDGAHLDRSKFGDTLICPRCAYNLRGLTSDRCPECGLTLDWQAIIAAAQRRVEVPTFECRWRDRPVASFFSTLWFSIQPWKLWKRISLTSDPRPGSLLLFVAVTLPLFMIAMLFLFALSDVGSWAFVRFQRGRSYPLMQLFVYQGSLKYFLQFNAMRYLLLLTLGLFVYSALCIFQRSLLGFRVRRIHLLRIAVLVFSCMYTMQLVNDSLRGLINSSLFLYRSWNSLWYYAYRLLDLFFLVVPTWSIIRAARDYLQVRRPMQFGLVILALGYLGAITVHIVYSVIVDDMRNMLNHAGGDMWPGLDYATARIAEWLGIL